MPNLRDKLLKPITTAVKNLWEVSGVVKEVRERFIAVVAILAL
jgi:hypothetical protein